MKNMTDTEYFVNDGCTDHEMEKLTNINDLGVIFDSELSFRDHNQLKINQAGSIFSERTTLRSLYAISRPSVVCCLLSVCCLSVSDVGAPYSGG